MKPLLECNEEKAGCMCMHHVSNTFKGEQCPLERAQCSGLISGIDLLQEAVCVVAPERACKAVDA